LNYAANTEYFIGYWLPQTQNIVNAFGSLFDDVYSVQGEDWLYKYSIHETPTSSTTKKDLVYGKAYIVTFNTAVEDFQWHETGISLDPPEREKSENFIYNDLPCYEAIDVMNIPEEIIEIGVFQEDVCVGAIVVQDSSQQILAYTSSANRNETPLSFEVLTNCREGNQVITSYKVMDEATGIFAERPLIAGQQRHSVIIFCDPGEDESDTPAINSVVLHRNYPNPFNPVTNISFSLPEQQNIKLTVYNMKGQKVCQLTKGHYLSGKHSVIWDGTNDAGKTVASGLYLYKLQTATQIISRKMLMLK